MKTKESFRKFFIVPLKPEINKKINFNTSLSCPLNSIQIAYFGQSNSANYSKIDKNLNIPKNIYQYDWNTEKCYLYKEPLLGTDGKSGNAITYTAIEISKITKKPIIIIPFGVGGSSVLQWAYGNFSYLNKIVYERIKRSGLYPQIFLWHQGESDSRKNYIDSSNLVNSPNISSYWNYKLGLQKSSYISALQIILDRTFDNFPNSKFGIALATRCQSKVWKPVRDAQKEIVKNKRRKS